MSNLWERDFDSWGQRGLPDVAGFFLLWAHTEWACRRDEDNSARNNGRHAWSAPDYSIPTIPMPLARTISSLIAR